MDHLPRSPLPGVLVPLYGRERDLSQLLTLLHGGVRLLTLRGPGGIGKTALAVHLAKALRAPGEALSFDHVQFIDLSALREPEQVMGLIAASLPDSGLRGDPERRIRDFAADRRTVLILDNFEQLLPAAPNLGQLLDATPGLHLVVTSRTVLRLHDEVEYAVEPLALAHRVRDAISSAAVQLFVSRLQALTPAFALSEANAPQVVRLCEVLEGVPLALELAAMRTRTYSLSSLLARLEHPLDALKTDFRDRPERLQSLRATVQWSYDLLSDVDRAVFECCAVFSGPFTPQALEAVWGSPDVLDRAESLLEQSFLQRLNTPDTFWKMLQPLRELALEHLEGNPQEAIWRERHARYFLNVISEEKRDWQSETVHHYEGYLPHYPNIRAGLVWAVEARSSDVAYRYLGAVGGLWTTLGLNGQEAPLAERVLALPPPEDRVTLLDALESSLSPLGSLGQYQLLEARLHEILALRREQGDVMGELFCRLWLAEVARHTGQGERAWEIGHQVIHELQEQASDTPLTRPQVNVRANAYLFGAHDLLELGRYGEALEHAKLAYTYFQDMENRVYKLESRIMTGVLLVYMNRLPEASSLLVSCLQEAVDKGFRGAANNALFPGLTLVAAELEDWTSVVRFTGFVSDPNWERSQSSLFRRLRLALSRAREVLGEETYQQAWTTGTQLQLPDIVELAKTLVRVPNSTASHPELTPREWEVLALVSQGHPDRRVARLLGITTGTASKHVGNLLSKLGLRNRVELTRWAIEHTPPDDLKSRSP
ncbi:ATP-binding protein [Deinococcus sonorensis]|uniref:ATP-binding protein n=1 Tax=Deinococcus sonorensis TaxID=309891 RepID=A0ABV8YC44_9DEIO